MHRRIVYLFALVTMVVTICGSSAELRADCWGGIYGFGDYGGFLTGRLGNSAYGLGRIPTPPYFAIHPPVYYSYPVPRTYGYSPFAYPGFIRTPDVVDAVEPAVIENPYFEGTRSTTPPTSKPNHVAGGPQEIINPYVRPDRSSNQWAGVQPSATAQRD